MSDNNVKKVVIVGGGSAGWMTAAALSNALGEQISIKLVESEQIGTIGVGEASFPEIREFNKALGINEHEFIAITQGTFKLGIEFNNWGKLGNSYFYPFGNYGLKLDSIQFYHHWQKHFIAGGQFALNDFSICAQAAKNGKFMHANQQYNSPLSQINYAYHFDAGKYAIFLKNYALQRGVIHTEGLVEHVIQYTEAGVKKGFIKAIILQSGETISGDLFIDCTGFKALLIEETLKTGYQDWSHLLPCNSAVTIATENVEDPVPYTRSTAHSAGWQWRIPLQNRVGNGHVYCSSYMTRDEATAILLDNVEGKLIGKPKHIKFTTGIRNKFWHKNCVAIGLSGGFLEPLESTSLHLIQSSISKLIGLFPAGEIEQVEADQYNKMLTDEFLYVRDFLVLHYNTTTRDDSVFWRYCRDMPIPETLQKKIALYQSCGRIFPKEEDMFGEESWLAVMHGQGLSAENNHPAADVRPIEVVNSQLEKIKTVIEKSVITMPTHQDYIQKYCLANTNYTI